MPHRLEIIEKQSAMWYAVPLGMTSGRAAELDDWCTENFGQGITGIKEFPEVAAWPEDFGRWGLAFGRIFFRSKEDMLMFMLRWGA